MENKESNLTSPTKDKTNSLPSTSQILKQKNKEKDDVIVTIIDVDSSGRVRQEPLRPTGKLINRFVAPESYLKDNTSKEGTRPVKEVIREVFLELLNDEDFANKIREVLNSCSIEK